MKNSQLKDNSHKYLLFYNKIFALRGTKHIARKEVTADIRREVNMEIKRQIKMLPLK